MARSVLLVDFGIPSSRYGGYVAVTYEQAARFLSSKWASGIKVVVVNAWAHLDEAKIYRTGNALRDIRKVYKCRVVVYCASDQRPIYTQSAFYAEVVELMVVRRNISDIIRRYTSADNKLAMIA